jgi:hypothetical protein
MSFRPKLYEDIFQPAYQSNHFANFLTLHQVVQNQHSAPFNIGTSIGSHQSHPHNVNHDHLNEAGSSPTNQACLPPQVGFPVQATVSNHLCIPWNTGIDSQPWLDDTYPLSISEDSNASNDVSDFVTQDLFDPGYPSPTIQNPSPTSFNRPGGPANVAMPIPQPIPQAQAVPATSGALPTPAMPCSIPWCTKTFRRKHEQVRHEASVHGINQGIHRCLIIGCPSSQGRGFSRKDKLTEHMWKKHENLGYAKRVL